MTETIGLIASLTTELLKKFPNYDQYKRNQYFKLLKEYERALTVDYGYRDDNRIDILRDNLKAFAKAFITDIEKMEKENAK